MNPSENSFLHVSESYTGNKGLTDFSDLPERKCSIVSLFFASFGGAAIGILVSLIVNTALVELSINGFFAIYFAILSCVVGFFILWRVVHRETPDPDNIYQKQLAVLSYIVIFSGILCFMLTQDWFTAISPIIKIPVYSILGISVAFALSFTLVDILNVIFGLFQSSAAKPLVQSVSQVRLVVFMTVLMGGTFGTIFGLLDVEDSIQSSVQLAMMREENYCYPIGAVLGALAGFGTEYLREREIFWARIQRSEFDDDI